MIVKRAGAAALLAALLWTPAVSQTAGPPDLLRASATAALRVSFVGQLETVRFSSKKANATLVRVEHRAPLSTRRSFLAPESLYGDYVIVRGDRSYYFDVKHVRMTVEREAAAEDAIDPGDLDRVLANYRPVVGGGAVVAGRPTTILTLVNKYTGVRTVRLWIDNQTALVLRREEYRASGAVATTSRFEELRYTNDLPDDLFSVKPPEGFSTENGPQFSALSNDVDGAEREAGFRPFTPKNLPQGFVLAGAQCSTVDGVKTLRLSYSDGLRALSLFENARGAAVDFGTMHPAKLSVEGHDAELVEEGSTSLLAWREQNLHFALVGDLSRNELLAIARSVVP